MQLSGPFYLNADILDDAERLLTPISSSKVADNLVPPTGLERDFHLRDVVDKETSRGYFSFKSVL